MTIDYYRTLGVLDDAEDIVIKAAYRALAQRYHPDRWAGNAAEATRRMSAINEAYAVLSDPEKRRAYDAKRDKTQYQEDSTENKDSTPDNEEDADQASKINRDWEIAIRYEPGLISTESRLNKISHALGFTFRLTLLENKEFSSYKNIAANLEHIFLEKYFGKDLETLKFALELILEGKKDAAKELNNVIRVMGMANERAIRTIAEEFQTKRYRTSNQIKTTAYFETFRFGKNSKTRSKLARNIELSLKNSVPMKEIYRLIQEYSSQFNPYLKYYFNDSLRNPSVSIWLKKDSEHKDLSLQEFISWIEVDASY